jgi:hypothetical protein
VAGLRGSFRCVAPDYPGFGLSSAPPAYGFTPREQSRVLEEFVDRLQLRDVTLVMQDWGGPIPGPGGAPPGSSGEWCSKHLGLGPGAPQAARKFSVAADRSASSCR